MLIVIETCRRLDDDDDADLPFALMALRAAAAERLARWRQQQYHIRARADSIEGDDTWPLPAGILICSENDRGKDKGAMPVRQRNT